MNFLDNPKNYHLYDNSDFYLSLQKFGRQFESGWHAAEFLSLPFEIEKIRNLIIVGMGGSNLAGEVMAGLSPFLLNLPFEIVANYRLPSYVDKSTLVILSSYSGNTEEVLSCLQDATMRSAKIIAITAGGKLKHQSESKTIPVIDLDPKFNPSHDPRAGIFLSLGATLSLFSRLNPVSSKYFIVKDIVHIIDKTLDLYSKDRDQEDNPAKILASRYKSQGIIFFAANHLNGVGKVFRNFINETSKTFCTTYQFPDLNHHLLDGLTFPVSLKDSLNFLILNSRHYPEVIQKRIQATKEVLLKQKYQVTVIKPESDNPVLETFESLVFLIMFSYYLSIVNKVDPITNDWVNYFKKHLN